MNPAIPLDDESGQPGRLRNRIGQVLCDDCTPASLPGKNELLLLLRLNRIHKLRQKLPEWHMEQTKCFSFQRSSEDGKR